ncbi:alpha/beta hydrolase [Porphyromonas sp.]|uniref:alpha/beta hydrolase n=1 Tax=Porphyromonas sp. TaxID=1924944 RepID=UPI0026DBA632|nr:alpha/beta hydrolase [Porphyromonas sp.]MDO4771598.1 alpha/beta hydrolase [Porphyromonas sp.]
MRKTLLILALLSSYVFGYAQELAGTWKGELDVMGSKLGLLFHISKEGDKPVCKMEVPAQGVKDFPIEIRHLSSDSLSLAAPMLTIEYTGKLVGEMIKGTFKQSGMTIPLDLSRGDAPKVKRPQTPQPPFEYETKEVTFANPKANATFSGTLTYPVGYAPNKDVPVVLLVSGSGAQNRDEEIFEHKPFLILADHLARHGVASLRYDDRGIGLSTGRFEGATTIDFADDANAGLDFLRGLGEFGKVGVLGHSEGASIGFILGNRQVTDFVISMAGPGVKGEDILMDQMKSVKKRSNPSAPELTPQEVEEFKKKTKDQPWLSYFMSYDPSADIAGTAVPVMAINGSLDIQVRADMNIEAIRKLLKPNPKNVVKVYEGLNHLFQNCTTGQLEEYYTIEETMSPEVMNDISMWIKSL